jgi:predicted  nucleic acid-binding Zn-ribbon protein
MDNKIAARLNKIQSAINDKKAEKISAEKAVVEIEKELNDLGIEIKDIDDVIKKKKEELDKLDIELTEKVKLAEEKLGIKS